MASLYLTFLSLVRQYKKLKNASCRK